jgi:membrane protein YqaA with SNARE-associated domain
MWYYFLVFITAFIVDLVPFAGPPAWTVMVFFQMRFDLNVWLVLIIGVIGSTCGRYMLSRYIPWLSSKLIKVQKNEDLQFIGQKLAGDSWRVQLFVLLYTLMPLPSTPLFTAAGMAKIRPMHIIPAFFIGKFTSDMIMVLTGDYVANNAQSIAQGFLTWKSISGTILGIIIICVFLFIDWRKLLQQKEFRLNFNIWK